MELSKEQVEYINDRLDKIQQFDTSENIEDLVNDIRAELVEHFCSVCYFNSCGEIGDGCHNRCESLYGHLLFVNIEQYLLEKEKQFFKNEINRPNIISKIIDDLKERQYITDDKGFYCDHYIKTFDNQQKELDEYYTNVKRLLELLEKVEVSDSDKEFHPNAIHSCRALDASEISDIMNKLKRLTE